MKEIFQENSKLTNNSRNGGGRKLGIVLAICAAGAACLSSAAGSLDGVFRSGSPYVSKDWTYRDNWDYHRLVQNGGVAYLLMDSFGTDSKSGLPNKLNMDVSGLTLAGLQIEKLTSPIYSANGYSINLCGASPFVGRTATTGFQMELPLVGDGTNVLRKTGAGLIRCQSPVQDFGAFELWEGTACAPTNATASPAVVAAGTPLVVRGGQLRFDAANSEATVGELRVGPGVGRVTVANGASVTLGALSREPGGVAALTSDAGGDALGDTEKILVSSGVQQIHIKDADICTLVLRDYLPLLYDLCIISAQSVYGFDIKQIILLQFPYQQHLLVLQL